MAEIDLSARMRRALIVIALAALAGCAAPMSTDPTPEQVERWFDESRVTLRDGSTVTCLTYERALDCDWSER